MSKDTDFLKVINNKRRLKARLRTLDLDSLIDAELKFTEVVHELEEQLKEAEKEKADKQSKADAFLAQARESGIDDDALLAALGITVDEAREGLLTNAKNKVKYRRSANETWVGIGRRPKWVLEIEARGEDLSKYEV